jgi:hypothetical protein
MRLSTSESQDVDRRWFDWPVPENAHRQRLYSGIRNTIADSLDLDKATQPDHAQESRWDYLLGHTPSVSIVALEPHSAEQDQTTKIIDKKKAAQQQLSSQLKPGNRIAAWIWVASSKIFSADPEKVRLRIAQEGIRLVASTVLEKHLPDAKSTTRRTR